MYSHCRRIAINIIEESGIAYTLLPMATDMMCTVSMFSLVSDEEPSGTDSSCQGHLILSNIG